MTKTLNTKPYTDIKRLNWIESLPENLRPYAYLIRLDRPIGIWLLLLPGFWGITLASNGLSGLSITTLKTYALFTIGAILMRGAGCVINDLWDKDLDAKVERTQSRPIANGAITQKQGIVFFATLLLISLIILLQFNLTTIILGFLAVPLIIAYPLMKRITWWPQAFLGLTFNFSALMGWSAMTDTISLPIILIYLGGIFWTIAYDTIYAHQDIEDDIMAGIKSTARLFKNNSVKWVSLFFALSIICITLGIIAANGINLTSMLLLLPALHIIYQIKMWQPENQSSALSVFKSNKYFGILIWLCTFV